MTKKITICMFAAMVLAACSNGDDVQNGLPNDEHTSEQSASNEPIVFAPVELADMQWETMTETEPTRGGSIDSVDFTMDSLGVFCMARKKLVGAPTSIALQWSSSYTRIRWKFNEMAEVKGIGGNKGEIFWSDSLDMHFYPGEAYYTYCFFGYHPWTQYVDEKSNYIKAYIKVDGNDDVIHAIAAEPKKFDIDAVDTLAYSKSYFNAIRNQGRPWEGTYPKFVFQHLMSRLNFYFCFDENSIPAKNLHVDKVEFDDFPCLLTMTLAMFDKKTGVVNNSISPTTTIYVQNNLDSQLGKLEYGGQKLKDIDPQFASAFGHFELREKGETPISGIREGIAYKYNLTGDYKKVGDCILIPPVKNSHSKSTIKLFVTLCDDTGTKKFKNKSAIQLACPETNWVMGASYDVKIKLNAPPGYGTALSPAMRSASTSPVQTSEDGVTLWQPDAKVSITAHK